MKTRKCTDEIAARLGPHNVIIIEMDDKARVPLSIDAASKQGKICMGYEIVTLNDHDFPIGPSHRLIPSVYAFNEQIFKRYGDPQNVTWSGATQIFVRSGYHDSATSWNHFKDLDRIFQDPRYAKYHSYKGQLKKVKLDVAAAASN